MLALRNLRSGSPAVAMALPVRLGTPRWAGKVQFSLPLDLQRNFLRLNSHFFCLCLLVYLHCTILNGLLAASDLSRSFQNSTLTARIVTDNGTNQW